MLQNELKYYVRRFLDDAPTQSLAAGVYVVEGEYASIKCTDGDHSSTFDFFFRNEPEEEAALRKLERMQEALQAFGMALREQIAKNRALRAVTAAVTLIAFSGVLDVGLTP